MTFAQFCAASPAGYEGLRKQIERCAQLSRSYEFPNCKMPIGCVPGFATLGFVRQGSQYLFYWRPIVVYRGNSRVLAALFSRSSWRFDSFEDMAVRLRSLRKETASPPSVPPLLKTSWPPLYHRLTAELEKQVLGQARAVEAAAFRLCGHVGKANPARPLSLIFYGPTGVGKSELGKALAPALSRCCGREYRAVWTELNTFTQPHSVHRLTGAPPGYVGYEDQPIFAAVRDNPFTVFMFDELEKAHPEVLKVFMSILDEGRCTAHKVDEAGARELDFRRCVFVFTSNADLSSHNDSRRLGFSLGESAQPARSGKPAASPAELAERLFQENEQARRCMVRQGVLAEIAGRFSGFIGFQPLDEAARLAITVKQIMSLGREYGLDIVQVDPITVQALTPGQDALSIRSSLSVLEGVLTPLFLQMTEAGGLPLRLSGPINALRLECAHPMASNSFTVLASKSS